MAIGGPAAADGSPVREVVETDHAARNAAPAGAGVTDLAVHRVDRVGEVIADRDSVRIGHVAMVGTVVAVLSKSGAPNVPLCTNS